MSGSAHTVQRTLGTRQVGAVILAGVLAIAIAVALAFGPMAASKPPANPPAAAPQIVTPDARPGTGGHNQQNRPQ